MTRESRLLQFPTSHYNEQTLFGVSLTEPFEEPGASEYWMAYPPQNRRAYAIVTHPNYCQKATEEHVRLAARIHDWIAFNLYRNRQDYFQESDRVLEDNEWIMFMLEKTHEDLFEEYINK